MAQPPAISRFNGLNNLSDPIRLGLSWLKTANNVNITDTGAIEVRNGYGLALAGSITSAYSTRDFQRLYVIDGGELKAMTGKNSAVTLATGFDSLPMHWTEINDQVFYNNGAKRGIIESDNTLMAWDWDIPDAPAVSAGTGTLDAGTYRVLCVNRLADGRKTGAGIDTEFTLTEGQSLIITGTQPGAEVYIAPANSTVFQFAGRPNGSMVWNDSPDNLGADLTDEQMDPLPFSATVIQAWRGRIYAAQYFPSENQTAVWFSQPLGFHLFNLAQDYIMVPGRVHMLAPTDTALIVGTDRRIHAFDGSGISTLAEYGAIPGQHWSEDDDVAKTLYFWTERGLCSAMPFQNLTDKQVSVAPGTQAGGAIVRSNGQKRYVVAIQKGGDAFNPHV